MEVISFFAGILFVYTKAWIILGLYFIAGWFYSVSRLIIFFSIGCVWAVMHDNLTKGFGLPHKPFVRHALLTGIVTTLPKVTASKTQFQFEVIRFNAKAAHTRIWMRCYKHCRTIHVGETWQLYAILEQPKQHYLPSEMDIRSWLRSNHIEWFGVVEHFIQRLQPSTSHFFIQHLREKYAQQLERLVQHAETVGLIQGLTIGVATHIPSEQWALFRRTGITHLVVISGEHIGLIAGAVFICIKKIVSYFPKIVYSVPAQRFAAWGSFIVAFFYAHLSGLGAPVERALIAFSVILLRYFLPVRFSIWQAWRLALSVILCIEPHMVLTSGLYLSFIAVAILVVVHERFQMRCFLKIVGLQAACLIGLLPLTLYLFSYGSWIGFVVNLLAIPWVGLLIVPTALVGLCMIQLYPWYGWLWIPDMASRLFLNSLQYIDTFSWMNTEYAITSPVALICIILGIALFIFMPLLKLFPLYVCLILFGFLYTSYPLQVGEAHITLFDVGQDLSVLIQTAHHTMLYGIGSAFFVESKMLPYLRYLKVRHIDSMMMNDTSDEHQRGLTILMRSLPIDRVWMNYTHSNQHIHPFIWDGVQFQLFFDQQYQQHHDTICALKISTAWGSILLMGNISKKMEYDLVHDDGQRLKADYFIVPHRGHKMVFSRMLLHQVHPQFALHSGGLSDLNHLSYWKVRRLYCQQKMHFYDTATCGVIQIFLKRNMDMLHTIC